LPIHAVTVEPRRTSFSLSFPGPSNGRSNVFVMSILPGPDRGAGAGDPVLVRGDVEVRGPFLRRTADVGGTGEYPQRPSLIYYFVKLSRAAVV
jgi:hypothetical protein